MGGGCLRRRLSRRRAGGARGMIDDAWGGNFVVFLAPCCNEGDVHIAHVREEKGIGGAGCEGKPASKQAARSSRAAAAAAAAAGAAARAQSNFCKGKGARPFRVQQAIHGNGPNGPQRIGSIWRKIQMSAASTSVHIHPRRGLRGATQGVGVVVVRRGSQQRKARAKSIDRSTVCAARTAPPALPSRRSLLCARDKFAFAFVIPRPAQHRRKLPSFGRARPARTHWIFLS